MAQSTEAMIGHRAGADKSDEKFRRAQRHSRKVRLLKIVLPLAAAGMAGGFVLYSYAMTAGNIAIEVEGTAFSEGKLVMANPKLEGFTTDKRPYSMRAERAVQSIDRQGLIELENLAAELPLDEQTVASVDAARAIYDRDANTLDVGSEMTLTTSDGMEARLKSVFLDIGNGSMRTAEPVSIIREGSKITSDSLTVSDGGKVLVFEKRVRVELDPARVGQQASGEPDAAQ